MQDFVGVKVRVFIYMHMESMVCDIFFWRCVWGGGGGGGGAMKMVLKCYTCKNDCCFFYAGE